MLIKESNKAKIETMIKKAEGKSSARTIDYLDIEMDIRRIEKKLQIPKKYMEGISATIDHHAQDFPKAYKYIPESTHYEVIRKKSGWELTRVYRARTRNYSKGITLNLTNTAKEKILEFYIEF